MERAAHMQVTIKPDEDLDRIKPLIEGVRRVLPAENVTVLEAPVDVHYSYPFPVVIVTTGPERGRHFGSDAVDLLRKIISEKGYAVG